MTDKIVRKTSEFIAAKTSRRSFLARSAVIGSALAVSPLRYLTRPESAYAAVVRPGECSSGFCTDGFTEFCCSINSGENRCPEWAYVAGWWLCANYSGTKVCSNAGVRYFVDCNRRPNFACPGDCHCAEESCKCRRTCCVHFRYGQCHTNVEQLTNVVCRIVRCVNPATISGYDCNSTLFEDPSTCTHEACCDCGQCLG
jgi:hypothetical protein